MGLGTIALLAGGLAAASKLCRRSKTSSRRNPLPVLYSDAEIERAKKRWRKQDAARRDRAYARGVPGGQLRTFVWDREKRGRDAKQRNPDFFLGPGGRVHPIRSTEGYNEYLAGDLVGADRKKRGTYQERQHEIRENRPYMQEVGGWRPEGGRGNASHPVETDA